MRFSCTIFLALLSPAQAQLGFPPTASTLPLEVRCDLDGDGKPEKIELRQAKSGLFEGEKLEWRVFDGGARPRFTQAADDQTHGQELTCVENGALSLIWRGCWGIDHICTSHFALFNFDGQRLTTVASITVEDEAARYQLRRRGGRQEIVVRSRGERTRVWRWSGSAFVEQSR